MDTPELRKVTVVEGLVVEMYARGLSTRDIEDLFRTPEGEVVLSRTSVSEITDEFCEEYEVFSRGTSRSCPWST